MRVRIKSVWLPAVVSIALSGSSFEGTDEVRCTYSARYMCDASGCRNGPLGTAYLLVPDRTRLESLAQSHELFEVRRCDAQGCTPVSVVAFGSGIFVNLSGPANGYLAKISLADGAFVELATQMLDVYGGRGRCPLR